MLGSNQVDTVRNYVSAIFAKLHVADRSQAALVARGAGPGEEAREGEAPN